VIGAAVLIPLQQGLNLSFSSLPPGVGLILYAVVVIVIMLLDPRGMHSLAKQVTAKVVSLWEKRKTSNPRETETQ
jgi:ABC-type branched-subunit amino acid transport system permease subunit